MRGSRAAGARSSRQRTAGRAWRARGKVPPSSPHALPMHPPGLAARPEATQLVRQPQRALVQRARLAPAPLLGAAVARRARQLGQRRLRLGRAHLRLHRPEASAAPQALTPSPPGAPAPRPRPPAAPRTRAGRASTAGCVRPQSTSHAPPKASGYAATAPRRVEAPIPRLPPPSKDAPRPRGDPAGCAAPRRSRPPAPPQAWAPPRPLQSPTPAPGKPPQGRAARPPAP